jgi:hypothetical protein
MRRAIAGACALLWLAIGVAAQARADSTCTTSRMSGMTFYTCHYSHPWQPSTTTTCFDRSGYCSTEENG